MAIFLTSTVRGIPKLADKPGAHWRLSPDKLQAIVEFLGEREAYASAKADSDTTELTRRQAHELGRKWDSILEGGA